MSPPRKVADQQKGSHIGSEVSAGPLRGGHGERIKLFQPRKDPVLTGLKQAGPAPAPEVLRVDGKTKFDVAGASTSLKSTKSSTPDFSETAAHQYQRRRSLDEPRVGLRQTFRRLPPTTSDVARVDEKVYVRLFEAATHHHRHAATHRRAATTTGARLPTTDVAGPATSLKSTGRSTPDLGVW
eukprot:CAMPEP_0174885104 /NCGR_PEP_ID=MMETSP0167-20121228/481_1 /TAXON_ID=38298 /ORGANISM="Rhodella maculata, Strain CCMP736" /LENGTH=182 /DNA_ID=CAMNT_0016120613 /DNA_START=46 /DNA_END=591 /DNA_ORIENTATION=+